MFSCLSWFARGQRGAPRIKGSHCNIEEVEEPQGEKAGHFPHGMLFWIVDPTAVPPNGAHEQRFSGDSDLRQHVTHKSRSDPITEN